MVGEVQIAGLREFRRALKEIDTQLPKELSKAMRTQVAGPVAARVQVGLPQRKRPRPRGQRPWATEIRPGGSAKGAYITWGRAGALRGARGWLEFGGKRPRDQVKIRPHIKEGRYVYPVVERAGPSAARVTESVIRDLARKAGFDLE